MKTKERRAYGSCDSLDCSNDWSILIHLEDDNEVALCRVCITDAYNTLNYIQEKVSK